MPVPTMPPMPKHIRWIHPSVGFNALCGARAPTDARLLRRFQKAMQRSPVVLDAAILRAMTLAFPNPLLVMALPLESQGVFERAGLRVLYTGVGKVNATYALARRLAEYQHAGVPRPRVINFGTVGSRRHATGATLECNAFVQRGMDV